MKKTAIYILLATFILAACEPINTRDELSAPLTEQQIKEQIVIDVRATVPGGNQIIVENKSMYGGRWVFPTGTSNRKTDTIVMFPPGSYTIQFNATADGGIVTVGKEITIEKLTHDLTPPYSYLIGNLGQGVTWVYAKDHPDGSFWGMVADYDWEEFWWFPDYTGEKFDNEFTFTYDNGFTFIQDGVKGTFKLNPSAMELTLTNPHLHMYDLDMGQGKDVMDAGIFQIKLLNENELVLVQKYPAGTGYDWIWRLKRKGYVYPTE